MHECRLRLDAQESRLPALYRIVGRQGDGPNLGAEIRELIEGGLEGGADRGLDRLGREIADDAEPDALEAAGSYAVKAAVRAAPGLRAAGIEAGETSSRVAASATVRASGPA